MGDGIMSALAQFDAAFERCPLIAILRGVQPDEVEAIGDVLVATGFAIIEVPLNSPRPLDSISRLAKRFEGQAIIGAGTVLRVEEVDAVGNAGGSVIVAPNTDVQVVAAAVKSGLVAIPGFMTPSEALAALDAGASALKLFPAEASSSDALGAMRAILPADTRMLPVGGIKPATMGKWRAAGAAGFGLGSALYRPAMSAAEVAENARTFIAAWEAA